MTTFIFDIPARIPDTTAVASQGACRGAAGSAARALGNGTVLVEARTG